MCIFIFHDLKSNTWVNPFLCPTAHDAIRATIGAVNKPGTNLSDFSADFVLYQSGSISDEDGRLNPFPDPVLITPCSSLKKSETKLEKA